MFIVSNKFTDFFRNHDLIALFNMLTSNGILDKKNDGLIEHAYERFFGYLIDYLGLRTLCLDLYDRENNQNSRPKRTQDKEEKIV